MASSSNEKEINYLADETNVRILGRTYFHNNILWMIYLSSGIEFNISANKLYISIKGDSAANVESSEGQISLARIIVNVNGERKLDELILHQDQTFKIFDEQNIIEGVVQVIKISEVAHSIAGIKSITVNSNGKISPTQPKQHRIEFIGDSITCGYGIEDLNPLNKFTTKTEDCTKAYAYKTATALNADFNLVSISGWGVISGFTPDPNVKNEIKLIPKYYIKLGFCNNSFEGKCVQDIDWNFEKFVPDVIVINLGTNDNSYCNGDKTKIEEFVNEYTKFLNVVKDKNPNAYIFCSLGIMGDQLYSGIENAVKKYKEANKVENISLVHFDTQLEEDGIAANKHPSEKTNEKAAKKLIEEIKNKMKW